MKIVTDEEKKLLIISAWVVFAFTATILALSFLLEIVLWTWIFSLWMGFFINVFCFIKSNQAITKLLYREYEKPKRAMVINNIGNSMLYLIIFAINMYFKCFNIFISLLGVLILKVVIYIMIGRVPKGGGKNEI